MLKCLQTKVTSGAVHVQGAILCCFSIDSSVDECEHGFKCPSACCTRPAEIPYHTPARTLPSDTSVLPTWAWLWRRFAPQAGTTSVRNKRGRQSCFHSCRTARLWSYLLLSCMPDCASVSPQLPARQLSPPAWCTPCQILLLEREVKAAALLMPLPFCHRLVFRAV